MALLGPRASGPGDPSFATVLERTRASTRAFVRSTIRRRIMKKAACVGVLLAFTSLSQAQSKKLKVYISADMEGIGGVSTWKVQAGSKGREYEKFRELMTAEVNAAIAGAFDAGATEILVSD